MVQVRQRLGVSERKACRVLGQARSTQRRIPKRREDEEALREDVVKVARRFGRYGYRMVTGMLRTEGWAVNHKRVERIWRQEGLKVPSKQPKRGRLWLTDGSCIRLRPLYRHHVWAYDFVADRTHDGRPLKMLTVLDEYSRECLAIVVTRRLQADDVLQTLSELFAEHGPPANLRSDNGPEFTARVVRQWLGELGVKTLFIEPGSPWENGYNESFNGTLRNELLKREIFYSLEEAKVLIEQWRREYNTHRPHSSLGYRPPGPRSDPARPKAAQPTSASWTTPQPKGGAWPNTLGGTAFGGRSRLNAALQGRYAIQRELGEGGMATVYLAKDLKHNRNVALKVLKPELAAVVGAERGLLVAKEKRLNGVSQLCGRWRVPPFQDR